MDNRKVHSFHIPVLGLAFSIDTPIRVARFGISSVISLVDDILIEKMRRHYSSLYGEKYTAIPVQEEDHRARRITAYLNLVHRIVQKQTAIMKTSPFESGSDIVKYFEMLPERSEMKKRYRIMQRTSDKGLRSAIQADLQRMIMPGAIDVNIMTKLDKANRKGGRQLSPEYSDALSALRGFLRSDLNSAVVLSAGMNPRLFTYMGSCTELSPDREGKLRKKIILKVSDFRSAMIQGKVLAKKGLWISEYRIESGLNCGGHAFATDGTMLGPILEEFKNRRESLVHELFGLYRDGLNARTKACPEKPHEVRVTVQGGIGTAREDAFLHEYYRVDGTGWGSPFLLVPEATNVDAQTRERLAAARPEDYYLSDASPLGVPFNNLRGTTSEQEIHSRAAMGKPGSPCTKRYLVSNTEFTEQPICTASQQYQQLKIRQLEELNMAPEELERDVQKVLEKACLCEGLAASALNAGHTDGIQKHHPVAVCPGPNLAFFSKTATLEEMVGYIYGRVHGLISRDRSHMFVNELRLYVDYLKAEVQKRMGEVQANEARYFEKFQANLQDAIHYYQDLVPRMAEESERFKDRMLEDFAALEEELMNIAIPCCQS